MSEEKHLAIAVPVIESERGWGSKIDDYMICLTAEDAKIFEKEFNSKNTAPVAPDWYMRADDDHRPIDITLKQYNLLKKRKRIWKSELMEVK